MVGPETGDDAGVFLLGEHALVATADFITPVCDDPRRFGRIAAANSLSDVYAMGGRPLFALNLCCFPKSGIPEGVLGGILEGAAEIMVQAGAALLGGHSVHDSDLKFGLAVIGTADPARLLTNAGAREGQRLILTKPLGTGVLINAYKLDKLDEAGLEPVLREMERLNTDAACLALKHGVTSATDITGFGLAGHALGMARASNVRFRIRFENLLVYENFYRLVASGVTTGCTGSNEDNVRVNFKDHAGLSKVQRAVMFDPQTSGGLLLATPPESSQALLDDLLSLGHQAVQIGEVLAGSPQLEVV